MKKNTILMFFITFLFFNSAGCVFTQQQYIFGNQTPDTLIRPMTPINSFSAHPIVSSVNLTIENARQMLINFSGNEDLSIDYRKTDSLPYGQLFRFSNDTTVFLVNSATGEITQIKNMPLNPENGVVIAQIYGKLLDPDLWNISDIKGLNLSIRYSKDLSKITYLWRETLYYPNYSTPDHYEIFGIRYVLVDISSYDGFLLSHRERTLYRNISLNLQPSLTEEQAWDVALEYFEGRGMRNILPSETRSLGLWIYDDSLNDLPWPKNGTQYLAWEFDVNHKQNYTMGGRIMIDAHDGHIINLDEIV